MSDENTNVTTQEETAEDTTKTVDLSKLTADQLIALSEEEWNEFHVTVKAAIAAKEAEAKAALKEKFTKAVASAKTYILPVIKYAAGAAVLLRVFGVI